MNVEIKRITTMPDNGLCLPRHHTHTHTSRIDIGIEYSTGKISPNSTHGQYCIHTLYKRKQYIQLQNNGIMNIENIVLFVITSTALALIHFCFAIVCGKPVKHLHMTIYIYIFNSDQPFSAI